MHRKNTDEDKITFSMLRYKQLGEDFNRAKIHLNEAANAFDCIKERCEQIERETGVNMCFLNE